MMFGMSCIAQGLVVFRVPRDADPGDDLLGVAMKLARFQNLVVFATSLSNEQYPKEIRQRLRRRA